MKTDSGLYRFHRRVVGALAILCLLVMLVLPSPVQAQKITLALDNLPINISKTFEDIVGFADVLEMLATILELANGILSLIGEGFDAMFGAMDDALQSELAVKQLDAQIEKRYINYMMNSNWNDKSMAYELDFIMDHVPPRNAHICRQTILRQGGAGGQGIVDGVARMVTDAWISSQRGVGHDATGPKGVMFAAELRCLNKYGNPIDGYPASCFDLDTKVGTFQRMFVDADILPSTLDGAVPLEIPQMENVEYKIADGQTMAATIANPQNNEQKMWVAALNFCLQMAGPTPTPPAAAAAITPTGINAMGQYRSAITKGSALVHQCGLIMGYYSRPNSTMTAAIEEGNKMCRTAVGKSKANNTNYLDEKTIKEKFGDCKLGLSKYQREHMDRLVCKSPQYFMMSANSGTLTPDMMDEAVACGKAWNLWELNTTTLQGSLVDLVRGHMKNRKAFSRFEASRQGGRRASAQDSAPTTYLPAAAANDAQAEAGGNGGDASSLSATGHLPAVVAQ